jgi:hypothetical protein
LRGNEAAIEIIATLLALRQFTLGASQTPIEIRASLPTSFQVISRTVQKNIGLTRTPLALRQLIPGIGQLICEFITTHLNSYRRLGQQIEVAEDDRSLTQ